MKTLFAITVAFAAVVFASAQTVSAPKSHWRADSTTRNGSVVRFDGHVEIAACGVITADHAVGGPDATNAELTGNVHLRLTQRP